MARILLTLLLAASLFGVEISVLDATDQVLRVQIDFPEPHEGELTFEGQQLTYPRMSNTQLVYSIEQERLIPRASLPLLLPPDGSLPRIEIVEHKFVREGDVRDQRAKLKPDAVQLDPLSMARDELVHLQRTEDFSAYNTANLFISPFARAGERLEEITLLLSFQEFSTASIPATDDHLIKSYLNAGMAAGWRKNQSARLAKSTDILPTGDWYKIPISSTGIHRINAVSFGSSVPESDPRAWQVYAPEFEGEALPKQLEIGDTPANLRQISTQGTGLEDGALSGSDEILFFARPLNAEFAGDNFTHLYGIERYYWLCIPDADPSSANAVATISSSNATVTDVIESYEKRFYHESEITNQLHSGESWVGQKLNAPGAALTFNISDDEIDRSAEIHFIAHFRYDYLVSKTAHDVAKFDVTLNDLTFNTTGQEYSLNKSHLVRGAASATMMNDGDNVIRMTYHPTKSTLIVYLDSLRLSYQRYLAPSENFLFGTVDLSGPVNQLNFRSIAPEFKVWDISDPVNVLEWVLVNDQFTTEAQGKREIIGFNPSQALQTIVEPASDLGTPKLRSSTNQADYIIIAPETFLEEAERMKELRENLVPADEQLRVHIATVEDIYDEFSAGTQDPGAIKHFLHYSYFSWQSPRPAYVLLMGDADYDYRNISGLSKTQIPTIQIDATSELRTYPCDDRYAYLASGPNDDLPDMAVGRLPAQTLEELSIMVDKIITYATDPEPGLWRNTITLVGDDPLRPSSHVEKEHIRDSELIQSIVPKSLYVDKLYLTEYPEEQDPNSPYVKKPKARDDLIKKLYNGTLLVNYLGHGSPNVWAQENVFTSSDLGQVKTGMRLPFWIAGTCDWAKYDDIGVSCTPEELLRMDANGAVGILSASRKTYATYNILLLSYFFEALFPDDGGSRAIPIGDAYRIARNQYGKSSAFDINSEKYILLSDPALRLASPVRKGQIRSISPTDLKAMSRVSFAGVTDTLLSTDAQASVTVYDTPTPVTRSFTYNNGSNTSSISYVLPGKRIFRGLISVLDSTFAGSFTLPKDIKYSGEGGILNVQYWDGTGLDGNIFIDTLKFLGSDSTALDEEGPSILFLSENMVLLNGDNFSANEALQVELSDPQGINLTGAAGHGISLAIDEDWGSALDLTELFEYDLDKSDIGHLSVYLTDIQPGAHKISIKAWDTQNNPNETSIRLTFFGAGDFRVYDLFNFPNPMSDDTEITYMLSHDADVKVGIYSLAGRKLYSTNVGYQGQGFNTLPWDGRDDFGNRLANGVYIIVVEARNDEFDDPSQILQKVVIAR